MILIEHAEEGLSWLDSILFIIWLNIVFYCLILGLFVILLCFGLLFRSNMFLMHHNLRFFLYFFLYILHLIDLLFFFDGAIRTFFRNGNLENIVVFRLRNNGWEIQLFVVFHRGCRSNAIFSNLGLALEHLSWGNNG